MTSASILRFFLAVSIDFCCSFCFSKHSRTNMKQVLSYRENVVQRFIRYHHKTNNFNGRLTSRSMSQTSDALVESSPSLTDYEFLDCGDLKRLERFGDVVVVRSCPSATWPKKISSTEWNKATNIVYDGSSGKNGKWTGLSNLKPNWQVEFQTTNVIENQIHEKESNNNENPATNINDNKKNEKDKKVNEILNNKVSKIVFTLSCSEQGQLGVFPEQQENWKWIGDSIRKALEYEKIENEKKNIKIINPDEIISEDYSLRKEYSKKAQKTSPTPISQKYNQNNQNTKKKDTENSKDLPIRKFLNGFAYTGGSSLAALSVNDYSFETVISSDNIMSSSSALQVVHLDAAKSSVQWAMRNAVASGLISSTDGDSDSDSNDRCDNNSSSSISNGESSDSADKSNDNNRNGNSNSDSNSNDADVENNNNKKNNNDRNERSDKKIIGDKNKQSSALSSSPSLLTSSSSSSLFVSSSTSTSSSTSFPHTSSARWITDDCLTFLEREIRRGNKYDGLIFDPPAFGRASSGKIWKLEKDLPVLVEELIPQLLISDPLFVLLSCHDVSWPPEKLAEILSVAMSSVMKNAMLLNIKAMKKNKASAAAAQVISKNGKNDRDKDKLKDNENKNKNIVKKGPKNTPENSDKNIQSVFLAGGILEYGPMILTPNKFKNNVRKLEIGNPLPLGGFARWSKIID